MAAKRKVLSGIEEAASVPAIAIASGADAWVDAQAAFVAEVDSITQSWVRRRREAIEDTRRMLDDVHGSHDPGEMWLAQQNWLSGAMKRMVADCGDVGSFALRCASRAGDRFLEASQRTGGAMEQTLATAGDKPGQGETGEA